MIVVARAPRPAANPRVAASNTQRAGPGGPARTGASAHCCLGGTDASVCQFFTACHQTAMAAASAGTAVLSGCGEERPIVPSMVSIVRAPVYDQRIYATIRRMVEEHRLEVRGRHVVIKPNLVEFEPDCSINTHPLLVHAPSKPFAGWAPPVCRIAEGPGHRRNTLDLAEAAGYFKILPRFRRRFCGSQPG